MASIALSSAGSVIGGMVAGPMGAAVGHLVGGMVGNNLSSSTRHKNVGQRLSNLLVQTSTYGKVIPKIFGQCRVTGNIIWSLPIREQENTHSVGGGKGRKRSNHTSYSYSITLAIAICEGEIESIVNMWADAKLVTPYLANCRIYYGDESQMPDPTIQAHQGIDNTPAYRGLSYIVIENFPLAEYGNRIPNFTFEVKSLPQHASLESQEELEEKIRSVCIIPGSGEFVYDTQIQYKAYGQKLDDGRVIQLGKANAINANNYTGKADALLSLDQLERSCKNLKWASSVVCWFGTSLDASQCEILPGVEHRDTLTYPDEWKVSSYKRDNAHLITYKDNRPIYGGTPTDKSVIRYVDELKSRDLQVMFCPMLMIDMPDKPWRGHLSSDADSLRSEGEFFSEYKNFILHYAHLLKGKIDAFVIGSEFRGLTSVRNKNNEFPFVELLVELAEKVRAILGIGVKIIYAADWSEYHHTKGGWYNLDALWSSPYIDVIGINAYFPLTSAKQGAEISKKDIKLGWKSGEGYDHFIRHNQRFKLNPEYAWKNIEFWWNNIHVNPDNKPTNWKPRSKKIWFTEIGFASIDKTTNEPNIFYDPESSVGGIPKHSSGEPCYLSQRRALEVTLDIWKDSEMVDEIFLWCWDARPYPFWPETLSLWSDGYKWSRGHWLNGKLSLTTLADILLYFCNDSGIDLSKVDVSNLDDIIVEGFLVDHMSSNREYVEHICNIYNIECIESDGSVSFVPKYGKQIIEQIPSRDLLSTASGELVEMHCYNSNSVPHIIECLYFDKTKLYQQNVARITNSNISHDNKLVINSNIVSTPSSITGLVDNINVSYLDERFSFKFYLPPFYMYLEPGDLLEINYNDVKQVVAISNIASLDNRTLGECRKTSKIYVIML